MATLIGIGYKDEKRGLVKEIKQAAVTYQNGIHTDWRGRTRNHRQVTVLGAEGWEATCKDLGSDLKWTTRRANLLLDGVDLQNTTGKQICIGDVILEVTGELTPCYRMDEQVEGLKDALVPAWRGGVTCKLITEGTISVNDFVEIT